ncbi:MAG: hypothetical protein ABWX61_01110 [Paenisporosarcina sp.]
MENTQVPNAVNKDFLTNDLGLIQHLNTTIFKKRDFFVLSPSVQNKTNVFDLREVSLNKYNRIAHNGYLLIRYKERFLIAKLANFRKKMMREEFKAASTSKSSHWKFIVKETPTPHVVSQADNGESYPLQEPSSNQLIKFFS